MEAVLSCLEQGGEQEFLRSTRTALMIVQNVLSDPLEAKYRRIRAASQYVTKEGIPGLLTAIGYHNEGEYYVLPTDVTSECLLERKLQLVMARQETGALLGWDVLSSSLLFSSLLGAGRYGDIFRGRMDGREVAVKTLKPGSGAVAREGFDRELNVLRSVNHPNIVKLFAVTLTSDPTSLVLEYVPHCMLDVLHRNELTDSEILRYASQVAVGMEYLHSQSVLHCDLAARNLLLDSAGTVRVCDFTVSRRDGSLACRVPPSAAHQLPVRWTAPDVLKQLYYTRHADVWSFGILVYEFVTAGSVPYASFSNAEVKAKVLGGYRLPQPQGCLDDFYSVMMKCWMQRPTDRPHFQDVLRAYLRPLEGKLADGAKHPSTSSDDGDGKSLQSKGSKRSKVKELSYQSVAGKGGGLVRVYTALISPFVHRTVIVCSKKTTVADVVQTALAKCGKQELDAKSHSLALVTGPSSDRPTHYLDRDDRVLSVKAGAPSTAMFVVCVRVPGASLLEVIDSLRQDPSYVSAFDPRTRGYLVRRDGAEGKAKGKKGGTRGGAKEWRRFWCVLDGSTVLCYSDEEDEGVKGFESFLDFKGCSISASSSSNKKGHTFTVDTTSGGQYTFSATDKSEMLQWIEALEAASPLDVSPMLLHASGGAVVQTGFLDCQEFAYEAGGVNPLQPMVQRRLGTQADYAGTYTAVDYGKHWTVLKSSGLVQCLVEGRPETLFCILECQRIKVNNPKEMKEGVEYGIEVEAPESRFVLHADLPTDHFDWVLSMERILGEHGLESRIRGHHNRQSGYVTLKRLLVLQAEGGGKKLYSLPRSLNDMEDVYEVPQPPPTLQKNSPNSEGRKRSNLLNQPPPSQAGKPNSVPLPPKDYLPPPVPPRGSPPPPPLPPKGNKHLPLTPQTSTQSSSSDFAENDDEYVFMQPTNPPHGRRSSPTTPTTPGYLVPRSASSPSQPVTIPQHRRSSKRSILLRGDSESSSLTGSPPPQTGTSLSELQEGEEWVFAGGRSSRNPSIGSSHSLARNPSSHSLSSYQVSSTSFTLPTTHRNCDRSSGYSSPLLGMSPSPALHRSYSTHLPPGHKGVEPGQLSQEDISVSDGMMVSEAQHHLRSHPISKAGSVSPSFGSNGYASSTSSYEDICSQLPAGWERGYCPNSKKYFYFNSDTGASTWNIQEVTVHCQETRDSPPGDGWRLVQVETGQVYYYHQQTRETTWNVQDTWA